MRFEVTHPKVWKKVSEQNIPMKHKIKIYEKLGGAYRLGEDGGEQVFNKMTELLKHKAQEQNNISEDGPVQDHEVSMASSQLEAIIKAANELKGKIGMEERDIPAWAQDHISNAANYLQQANVGLESLNKPNNSNKEK
jgi:hypothetical protein